MAVVGLGDDRDASSYQRQRENTCQHILVDVDDGIIPVFDHPTQRPGYLWNARATGIAFMEHTAFPQDPIRLLSRSNAEEEEIKMQATRIKSLMVDDPCEPGLHRLAIKIFDNVENAYHAILSKD